MKSSFALILFLSISCCLSAPFDGLNKDDLIKKAKDLENKLEAIIKTENQKTLPNLPAILFFQGEELVLKALTFELEQLGKVIDEKLLKGFEVRLDIIEKAINDEIERIYPSSGTTGTPTEAISSSTKADSTTVEAKTTTEEAKSTPTPSKSSTTEKIRTPPITVKDKTSTTTVKTIITTEEAKSTPTPSKRSTTEEVKTPTITVKDRTSATTQKIITTETLILSTDTGIALQ